jgi:hypothetical protein
MTFYGFNIEVAQGFKMSWITFIAPTLCGTN